MSILSDFEDRVAHAVEGVFAGTFRSPVQPVEIAKALARAMDDGRVVGVGKVYAPVAYKVALSEADAKKLGDFQGVLGGELATYLMNHARERTYYLSDKPSVLFTTETSLKLGRFRVAADLASREAAPARPPEPPSSMATKAIVSVGQQEYDLAAAGGRAIVGRLEECDITLDDVNASRQHAAFVREGETWHIEDLGSTNGTKHNGKRVARTALTDGDVVTVGVTKLVFHQTRR